MRPPHPIHIARVYDPPGRDDGARILVDRLWPRGVARARLPLDLWPKEITPSDELRRWLHADPTRWPDFARRYRAELDAAGDHLAPLLELCRKGPVTLLTATRDPGHSQAPVLRDYLLETLGGA